MIDIVQKPILNFYRVTEKEHPEKLMQTLKAVQLQPLPEDTATKRRKNYLDVEFEKSPKLIATGELRNANDFLRRILQANSQTWIALECSKLAVDLKSHGRHYAELFIFRKESFEINKNTSKLPRDALALTSTSTLSPNFMTSYTILFVENVEVCYMELIIFAKLVNPVFYQQNITFSKYFVFLFVGGEMLNKVLESKPAASSL
ncbi:hypothetical protein ACTXT7_013456 [Hymenolepis weldensis]